MTLSWINNIIVYNSENIPLFFYRLMHPISLIKSLGKTRYPLKTPMDYAPFFIIGSGRSGNTLLRSILTNHKDISIPPESYFLPKIYLKYNIYNYLPWEKLIEIIINECQNHHQFFTWETRIDNLINPLKKIPEHKRSLTTIIDTIYQEYTKKHFPQAKIWGDKTPLNTLNLKWINQIYPKSKYIHIIRDGRAVASSYVQSGIYHNLEDACLRWNKSIDKVNNFKKTICQKNIIEIKYENLVNKPEETISQICSFLNVSYYPQILDYKKLFNKLGDVKQYQHHKNLQKSINQDSIEKWKKELTENQIIEITKIMEKNLKLLNYV